MFEYFLDKRRIRLNMRRDTALELLGGLNVLINNALEDSNADSAEVYSAIRCLIQAQFDEQDAKEASKHDS